MQSPTTPAWMKSAEPNQERRYGLISQWNDEKGFGFIAPRGGGKEVFVHVRAFQIRDRRPKVGDGVEYSTSVDDKGRPRADNVIFRTPDANSSKSKVRRGMGSIVLSLTVIGIIGFAAIFEFLPWYVPGVYIAASLIAYLLYTLDKVAAQENEWRISEETLHSVSLLGGWPGALVGQSVHRHKTKKATFRTWFWFTVVANCCVLAGVAFWFGRS